MVGQGELNLDVLNCEAPIARWGLVSRQRGNHEHAYSTSDLNLHVPTAVPRSFERRPRCNTGASALWQGRTERAVVFLLLR
jgi:hypothetical protein